MRDGDGDLRPEEFADAFRLDLADVYAALAYYYAHEDEMSGHRRSRKLASHELRDRVARDRPAGIAPDE